MIFARLFADAEAAEDGIEDLLGIDAAGDASQRIGSQPQLLRTQLGVRRVAGEKCRKETLAVGDMPAMPCLGEDGIAAVGEPFRGFVRQGSRKRVEPLPRVC